MDQILVPTGMRTVATKRDLIDIAREFVGDDYANVLSGHLDDSELEFKNLIDDVKTYIEEISESLSDLKTVVDSYSEVV